jgi:hypothetical protein
VVVATEAVEVTPVMEDTEQVVAFITEVMEEECTTEATEVMEPITVDFRIQATAVTETDTITTIEVQTAVIRMKGPTTDHRGPEVHQLLFRSSFPSAWVAAVGDTETTATTVATSSSSTQKLFQSN